MMDQAKNEKINLNRAKSKKKTRVFVRAVANQSFCERGMGRRGGSFYGGGGNSGRFESANLNRWIVALRRCERAYVYELDGEGWFSVNLVNSRTLHGII